MSRVVVITGGDRGIGRALTERFSLAGDKVIFTYHRRKDLAESLVAFLAERGGYVEAVACDTKDETAVSDFFAFVKKSYGRVNVLICNAGVSHTALVQDTTLADWDLVMDTSAKGTFLCVKHALPLMLAEGGRILTMASIWGETGGSCESAYSAAKGAVIGFTKALAKELGPSKITVNALSPGLIDTDMNAHLSEKEKALFAEETPAGRMGRPEEVASAAYFLASPEASFITGRIFGISGGAVI